MVLPWVWLAVASAQPVTERVRAAHDDAPRPWSRFDLGADLVVWYGAESRGELDGCGCGARPLGELSRLAGYFERTERLDRVPTLRLDAGHWAAPDAGADVSGALVELLGFDALNLTSETLGYVTGAPSAWERELPTVSANIEGADQARWRMIEVGGWLIGVTGVTGESMDGEVHTSDPLLALMDVLPEMRLEADFIVVLAADVGALGPQLAALPEVDVLIEAGGYESRLDPVDVDGSVWIRPEAGWRHLGELHVFGVRQPSWSVLDRRVEIDADLPRGRGVQRLLRAWSARRIEED
jgi:hypothetical protein